MLVSVVIPVYNRKRLLERAVRNVLKQTYNDIEVVVVDDGSEEDIKETVERMESDQVRYIRHATNKGASAARNTGIEHSNGDYIAFLDSDDYWSKYNAHGKHVVDFQSAASRTCLSASSPGFL